MARCWSKAISPPPTTTCTLTAQRLSLLEHGESRSGDLISRVTSDIDAIQDFITTALLGIVTPFCSCSAVPLFIGFVESGVPLGVTFSFLISAPMVNEVALIMLWGLFGWKIALLYLGLGLTVAIVAGWVIGRLKMEANLEDWVRQLRAAVPQGEIRLRLWQNMAHGGALAFAINGTFEQQDRQAVEAAQ